MTTAEILKQLERFDRNHCQQDALAAAAEHKEEIVPELIAALDRVSSNPDAFLEDYDYMLHIFALYLLAEWRETRALEPILHFVSLPGEQTLDLTGDIILEDGAQILSSVCDRNIEPLLRLARNENVNQYVRGQSLMALGVLVAWGTHSKDEIIGALRSLFQTGLARPGNGFVWAEWAGIIMDLNAQVLLPELREAFALGLVDERVVGLDYIEKRFQKEGENLLHNFAEKHPPVSAMGFAEWSGSTREEDEEDEFEQISRDDLVVLPTIPELLGSTESEFSPFFDLPPSPYIAPPKTGRNDPCPCGSGKKFKKCCGKS